MRRTRRDASIQETDAAIDPDPDANGRGMPDHSSTGVDYDDNAKHGNRGEYFVPWTPEIESELRAVLARQGFSPKQTAKVLKAAAASTDGHLLLWRQTCTVEARVGEYKALLPGADVPQLLFMQPDLIAHRPAAIAAKVDGILAVLREELGLGLTSGRLAQAAPALVFRTPGVIRANVRAYLSLFDEATVAKAISRRPGILGQPARTVEKKLRELQGVLPGLTLCQATARGGLSLLSSNTATLKANYRALSDALNSDFDAVALSRLVLRNMLLLACAPEQLGSKWRYLKHLLGREPAWQAELHEVIGNDASAHFVGYYLTRGAEPYARLVYLLERGEAEQWSYDSVLRLSRKAWSQKQPEYDEWYGPSQQWSAWRAAQARLREAPTE